MIRNRRYRCRYIVIHVLFLFFQYNVCILTRNESDVECFHRKNNIHGLFKIFYDRNNLELPQNVTKGMFPRTKKCWNFDNILDISTPIQLIQQRVRQYKTKSLQVRNITSIFRYNRHILKDLLSILENSIEIIPISDNLPEMYDYIRHGKVFKSDPFLNQHSPELWIPFLLQHQKYGSKLLHHSKVKEKNDLVLLEPLFYYIDAHIFTFGLYVGNENRVLIHNIQFYWNKIVLEQLQKHKVWSKANGFDVFIAASHPMTPLNINDEVIKLHRIAQATFLVTDHDMKSRYAKDTIIPYFDSTHSSRLPFTQSHNNTKSVLVFFAGNPNQHLRKVIIELFHPTKRKSNIHSNNNIDIDNRFINQLNIEPMKNLTDVIIIRDKMDRNTYLYLLHHSVFCLMIRGDTTSSSRLFASINAGCIPVIISDWIILPYERIIDYSTFTIQIEESILLNDPFQLIQFLRSIPSKQIQTMQNNLLLAREVLSYDTSQELNPVSLLFMDSLIHRINYCTHILGNVNIPHYYHYHYHTDYVRLKISNTTNGDNRVESLCNRIQTRLRTKLNIDLVDMDSKLRMFACRKKKKDELYDSVCVGRIFS